MANTNDSERGMGRSSPPPFSSLDGRASPPPFASASQTLTKAHIKEALARSSDDGATLDFSNKNLTDVGEEGAEELSQIGRGEDLLDECCILRIALVGNRLSTLPRAFAGLSRLRYLTLRSNAFSVFPEVLTDMPSLEILDFSRNRIRRFPPDPRSLVNLRVLSISRNKIHKLPAYLSKFPHLTVLKVDRNPIEWPPPSVLEADDDLDDPDVMHEWVFSLKNWLSENPSSEPTIATTDDEKPHLPSDQPQNAISTNGTEDPGLWSRSKKGPDDIDAGVTPHARSFSMDSESSIYTTTSYATSVEAEKPEKPSALDIEFAAPVTVTNNGFSRSPESYLPTPNDSLTSADDDTARPFQSVPVSRDRIHGRNMSYAYERRPGFGRPLAPQKSLPDLRSRAQSAEKRAHQIRTHAPEKSVHTKSLDGVAESPTTRGRAAQVGTAIMETPPLRSRKISQPMRMEHSARPSTSERRAPSMDYERNSYFRRLSSLPTSTISRTIPPALLSLVDSVRGILFGVSQIYQSLQHYTVYAIDERLSSVLLKVLDPASRYMLQLINALDRFDSTSRRGFPPTPVVRRVIECCRDNVAVFGKAIGVLALQLKVLASRDDVRYSRQMLLMLYGAMAEISNSWHSIAPQMEAVEPLLALKDEDRSTPMPIAGPSSAFSTPSKAQRATRRAGSRDKIPPIAEQPESPAVTQDGSPTPLPRAPLPLPLSRQNSVLPGSSAPPPPEPSPVEGRSRMARRHAGSFSVKDVETGRSMPSNHSVSPPSCGVNGFGGGAPIPRGLTRQALPGPLPTVTIPQSTLSKFPPGPSPTKSPLHPAGVPSLGSSHSHQGSGNGVSPVGLPSPGPRSVNALEVPSNSTTLVDKDAIEAMAVAVRAAPAVWAMLDEISSDMPDVAVDVHESLSKAQMVTSRLGENIKAIREGLANADRKALREDAHVFVRMVIQLSSVAKGYGPAHRLHTELWRDIARLTNATQEFVTLLHVSSFSPSSTPRPYSPALSGSPGASAQASVLSSLGIGANANAHGGGLGVGGGGGAGLSRSRSAQPAASLKVAPQAPSAAPRSALPNQSFRVPVVPARMGARLRSGEDIIVLRKDHDHD